MNDRSHPDLELLSDHDAGLLSAEASAEAEQHLEHCQECLGAMDSVVQVRGALRAVGSEPEAMPSDVTARLDEALREEAARSRGAGRHDAAATPEPGTAGTAGKANMASMASGADHRRTSRSGSRFGSRFGRGLAVAAGVAVLAVGGAVAYQSVLPDSTGDGPVATQTEDGSGTPPGEGARETYALDDGRIRLSEDGFDQQVRSSVVREPVTKAPGDPRGNPDSDPDGSDPGARSPRGDPDAGSPNAGSPDGGTQERAPSATDKPAPLSEDGGTTSGQADPSRCVTDALSKGAASKVLDVGSADFDGERALLAITPGPSEGTVRAYVVTGCPGDGTVAHQSDISVR